MLKLLKSGEISEETIHLTVMEWVALNPSIRPFIMHFPNEGKRSLRYGKLMKSLGMRKGVADLFVAMSKHNYHGAWIELKSRDGVLDPTQVRFLEDMRQQGYFTAACFSIDDAIHTLKWYCFSK